MNRKAVYESIRPIVKQYAKETGDCKGIITALAFLMKGKVEEVSSDHLWDIWDALGRYTDRTEEQEEIYVFLRTLMDLRGDR